MLLPLAPGDPQQDLGEQEECRKDRQEDDDADDEDDDSAADDDAGPEGDPAAFRARRSDGAMKLPRDVSGPELVGSLSGESEQRLRLLFADATAHAPNPNWLEVDRENLTAKVLSAPKREDLVQIQLNEQLIVELYSK